MERAGLGTLLCLTDAVAQVHAAAALDRSRLYRGKVRDFPDGK